MSDAGECDQLDAFIDGELAADAARRFEAHIELCADCRQQVEEQHWIDGLLVQSSTIRVEEPSAGFARSLKATLAQSRQRAGIAACVFAAAAVLLIAVGALVIRYRSVSPLSGQPGPTIVDNQIDETDTEVIADAEPIRATVITNADSLVVPIESSSPKVTIVRIYSTYQPETAGSSFASVETPEADGEWSANLRGGTL